MRWSDVISLIVTTVAENSMGDPVLSETSREVYANKKSIRQSEFYQAMTNGLKPENMFEIRNEEYGNEEILVYENKRYKIIRTYSKNGEILELICSGLVNGVS